MQLKSLHTILLACTVALGFSVTACDDDDDGGGGGGNSVCDQAGDIAEDECGLMPTGDESGGEVPACEGAIEAAAQCIVDSPMEFCAFFDDPTLMNTYTECATAAAGG